MGTINIAISLTALFSGLFIVGAGDIADKLGRVKMTYIGLALNIIGSLCLIIAPVAWLLLVGRALQGLSGALIMPSTLAIINEYYIGKKDNALLVTGLSVLGAVVVFVHYLVVSWPQRLDGSGFYCFNCTFNFSLFLN